MPAIQTTNLTKTYGSTTALDSLDLTVHTGEVYGFLGPNGAGKSTTIDLLMDYIRPTDGRATVLGFDAQTETEAVHSRVGILPDRFGVYATLTGRQHVAFITDANDVDDDPDELLSRVGLADAADQPARTYSKGMQRRLGLAMALVGDPDLLILDEPFSGLDPHGTRLVRELVATETQRGATVFFSSHVLDQVERVCDRVGLLADGQLVAEGTPTEIREDAGVVSRIYVQVADGEAPPEEAVMRAQETTGVAGVEVDGDELVVVCSDPTARWRVLERIEEGMPIGVFDIESGTIEDAFVTYTNSAE
ncbi:ABC-type transport system ATP-binding protein (plasmid) [Halobacterium hubeiense]|uniref:ABC-type transport system ATP-binding protein n=1 Tax=Halobacterium hubeiense TaxID=1407499 RepID=A0A0U5H7M5_9EURY|nr:ABC transporter ATP-binding protein [Halobacterium hubeiense]CQH64231.1 ABC-type transport system ATP-binding protein [Halobacterium hubeiense]